MATENKGFGALFSEKKNQLDHIQQGMASVLPSFPGMPAAKYFDLGIGIDFHDTVFPPAPLLPVPHIGMLFDIIAAIVGAIASVVPPPPPPPDVPEGEEPPAQPFSLASTAQMLVHMLSPSVKVHGQWIANAGTTIQHLPAIITHLPFPIVKPMASSEMWMGSSTVLADGGPFSTQFHPALSCNLVGMPAPFRLSKPKPKMALMAPTSVLLVMTSAGKPVLVGGPPTIDLFQLMFKLGLKGMTKLAGKVLQQIIDKIKTRFPRLAGILDKFKCKTFGEPVDTVTGRVIANNVDFELPGPIPFIWERNYYSDAEVPGSLGYNWHHSYNMSVYDLGNGFFSIRLRDGRETVMPSLAPGERYFNRIEQLWWHNDGREYYLEEITGNEYRFNSKGAPDGSYMLAEIRDNTGSRITFKYNGNGYMEEIIDSSNRRLQVDTDKSGRITCIHTRNGADVIKLGQYTYDDDSNMISTTNALGVSKYFHYKGHLLVKLTNQSGMSFYWEYEGKGDNARCVRTAGDSGVLAYHARYEEGKTITTNSLGHTTEYYYDDNKLIYKIIDGKGGITLQTYNEHQELEVVVNPVGNAIKNFYNEQGRLIKNINENGEASQYSYDEDNRLIGLKTPGGMRLAWSYNENGLLRSKTLTNGNVLRYEYEDMHLHRIVHSSGRTFTLHYDEQHNLSDLITPEGSHYSWKYDDLGRLIKEMTDSGYWHEYAYDAAGNMIRLEEADGSTHAFEYDASDNLIKAGDGRREVSFTYGPLGTLSGRSQNGISVRFNYDTELQLRSIANEGGELYRFEPDANGNIIHEWGFDGLHREYQRDGAGRIRKVLRPNDKWTTYDYDGLDRVVREEHNDGSVAAYGYNKDGLLTGAFNEDGAITIERDFCGRTVREVQGAYEVTREYNELGDSTFIGSSLGAAITLEHSAAGFLEKMQASQGSEAWQAQWQRNDNGLELQRELTGGITVQTQRDKLGRVQCQTIGVHNAEQSRTRYEWGRASQLRRIVNEISGTQAHFSYDEFDNLVSATYAQQDGSAAETIYRAPDKLGNLFNTPNRTDRKYGKGGRLLECPTYYYHYDAEGNLIFKEFKHNNNASAIDRHVYLKTRKIASRGSCTGWIYEWKANGLLHSVFTPTNTEIVFSYDPLGRRIAKVNKHRQQVTRWVWDGNVPLHEWRYSGNYPPHVQFSGDGDIQEQEEPVDNLITWVFEEGSFVPCAKLENDAQYSIISDHLGTPTHAFDASGNKVWQRELDCYGKVRKLQGDKAFCSYLYQGQYEDMETGLAYNRFRYYSVAEGIYISQDPSGLRGGMRLYSYVSDPLRALDIMGLIELIQVPYDDHPLAEAVKKFRAENPHVTAGQNVAAMKIEGVDEPIVRASLNGRHSEHYLLEELDKMKAHDKITHFYTELEPCSGIGMPECKSKLETALPADTKVTFSYHYPESDLSEVNKKARRKNVREKSKAVKKNH